jgi:hypothetical protein
VLGEVTETVYTVDEDADGDETVRVRSPILSSSGRRAGT